MRTDIPAPPFLDVLTVQDLAVEFPVRGPLFSRRTLKAVNGVSLHVAPGETLGLVGESGCGKSTLVRTILGLNTPSSGTVAVGGRNLAGLLNGRRKQERSRMQMVFQDPVLLPGPAPVRPRDSRGAAAHQRPVHGSGGERTPGTGGPHSRDGHTEARRILRRAAPAGGHCPGPGTQTGAADPGRTRVRTGCLGPGPGDQPPPGPAGRAGPVLPLHCPRSFSGPPDQPPRGRDVHGQDCRDRSGRRGLCQPAASLHPGPAVRRAHRRSGQGSHPPADCPQR